MNPSASKDSFRINHPLRLGWASARMQPLATLSIVLGVAIATAVITGALLIGDSMRGSLRALTIQRIGKTTHMVSPGRFFEVAGLANGFDPVALMYFPDASVTAGSGENLRRSGTVSVIGIDDDFWSLSDQPMGDLPDLGDNDVILNQALADQLDVKAGDQVSLRLPFKTAIPADSPLGRRDLDSRGLPRMNVVAVLPLDGLGRFGLVPNQVAPLNVFVDREVVADVLDRSGQANLLLTDIEPEIRIASDQAEQATGTEQAAKQAAQPPTLNIDLDDLGLSLQTIRQRFNEETVFEYRSLIGDSLLVPDAVVHAITQRYGKDHVQPVMTYLANAIETIDDDGNVLASVPYSMLTAIDDSPQLPLRYNIQNAPETTAGVLEPTAKNGNNQAKNENSPVPVVINSWTAEDLQAQVGSELRILYFEPEVEEGVEIEKSFAAVVADIVPITKPKRPFRGRRNAQFDQAPTRYNDPDLTPTVPGVTDADSIDDWDLPFPMKRKTDRKDDEYWENYRLTPKAFVPLAVGRELFGSRFGRTTSLRLDDLSIGQSDLLDVLQPQLESLGWSTIPIRDQQLQASSGTTPFDALFLSLSMFVIFSAILLIAMLLRLSLATRQSQLGTLLAIGWTPKKVHRWLLIEFGLLTLIGAALGVLLGIVDAKLILEALKTRWVGAVTTPFLNFHWTLRSLLLGGIIGGGIPIAAIAWVSRKQLKRSAVSLLASKGDEDVGGNPNAKRFWNRWLSRSWIGMLALGLVVMGYSTTLGGTQAAGGFVGGGMLLLLGSLAWVYRSLVRGGSMPSTSGNGGLMPSTSVNGLPQLAWTAAGRNPVRSTLAIGLMAIAAFLIVSMTAFQLAPSQTGTGGYEWIATTASPIYRSLSDDEYRDSILGSEADALESIRIEPIRRHAGQNASCNNLYRAAAPTVLGVRPSIAQPRRNADQSTAGFQWIGHAAMDGNTAAQGDSPWKRLETIATGTQADPIPVVIDQNTAMWSLGLYEGIGQEKSFRYNETDVYFRVVGLLGNSILQGRLIIGEANFRTLFPDISGDSFFLIDVDPRGDLSSADKRTLGESVSGILENRLSDVGMDVRDSDQVLTELLAVQNTYLRTFQSLGVLGLLLGTVGLAIAQVRSMVSRRGELALMRAIGYSRGRISRLVLGETMTLLLLGVGCGSLCALAALVPVWLQGGLPPSWLGPVVSLVAVCGFGIVAGGLAVAKVARMPILAGLRGDG